MADDWSAFNPKPAQDSAVDDWSAFNPQSQQPEQPKMPQAYLERVAAGQAISDTLKKESDRGVIDLVLGQTGPRLQMWPERMVRSGLSLAHDVMEGTVLTGPGLRKEDFSDDPNAPEPLDTLIHRSQDMAAGQIAQTAIRPTFGIAPLVDAGEGRVARLVSDPEGTMRGQTIGTPPRDADFKAAAHALGEDPDLMGPSAYEPLDTYNADQLLRSGRSELFEEAEGAKAVQSVDEYLKSVGMAPKTEGEQAFMDRAFGRPVEQNLRTLWEEKGIHPAEAVHDAESDAFLKADLTGKEPPLVPLSEQPASPQGKLTVLAQSAMDQLNGLGRNIQFMLDPMATGSDRAMVIAKDAINSVRRIRWDHARIDQNLVSKFEPDLERMWIAADEESVIQQQGKQSPIAKFRRDAAKIEATLPPVENGYVRMWRGNREGEVGANPQFTNDLPGIALPFREGYGGPLSYVDIPAADAAKYESHGAVAKGAEFILPPEIAAKAKIADHSAAHGLAALNPEQQAAIEQLHSRAQSAWLKAQDVGIVESEGLPAYTPRMVLNVAAAGENLGPRALNELGRNVFTRTSQMLHRKYLTAGETEAAAKELVGDRMAKQGASAAEIEAAVAKVQIAKNIRALPLATARLEEAAVWRDMINKIEDVGKAAGEPTVAVGFKPDNTWFTIAGHPAFTKWEPQLIKNEEGKWSAKLDKDGNPIFVPKPMYLPAEFRGPMTAILDETAGNSKAVAGAKSAYEALMAIKGKSMQAILNSPLIHNEVVWSKVMEAAGGREWLGFGLYFRGNRIVNNPGRAQELIERGLNPMGPRGSIQDITGIMERPTMGLRESWTSKVLAAVPGLFDEGAANSVKAAVDRAGDFWHNTLLWDRVLDVQFGLADHLSDRLVAKGADRLTADRIAGHFSNIIVGSIPKEAMSAGARATANMFLFSRSFTLGNLATFKQAALGLPKPVLAQIERDFFNFKENPETGVWAPSPMLKEDVKSIATGIARRKAISTIMMSAGLYYVGNAVIQHAFNIGARDSTLEEEMQGYARRYQSLMTDVSKDPFELRHMLGRLSPTYDNEPAKQDRAHIGYDKDGTAIYARNPTGKFGEEMIGYPTMPMEMLRRKLSPMASGWLDIFENDKGFGRKIYDENDRTIGGDVATAIAIAKHLVMKHLPEGQINAAVDLLRDDGDPTVNKLRLFGPAAGFTASVGAPGGMDRGEQLAVKAQSDARFNLQWPDIKKQIQRGDEDGARKAMDNLGLSTRNQISLIRSATNPSSMLRGHTLQNFLRQATPEQRDRFDRARGQ